MLKAESLNFLEEECIIYTQPCCVGTETDQKTADCIWPIARVARDEIFKDMASDWLIVKS